MSSAKILMRMLQLLPTMLQLLPTILPLLPTYSDKFSKGAAVLKTL
jgi:hypothetical protein